MRITRRQFRRIIREAQWGRFTGGAAPLDEPSMEFGEPLSKDQLRKMASIMVFDMGMTPDEVLQKPEFVEAGITDLTQLKESIMKITRRQLRRIIRESIGGPLPMDLVRRTGGYGPKPTENDPFLAARDGIIGLGPNEEETFKYLVLDLNVNPQEVADNFPSLASTLATMDQQTLIDIAESL